MVYWEDILVDRPLAAGGLKSWLVAVFQVSPAAIVVAPVADHVLVTDDTAVLCEFAAEKGDFPFRVAVFTRRADLDEKDAAEAVDLLCRTFGVQVLMSDDTANPYRMLLVGPDGSRQVVHLDPDALDEEERYIVQRVAD